MTQRIKRKSQKESIYSDELADRICEHISMGRSLRTIASMDGMPCVATMMNWVIRNQDFAERYHLARQQCLLLMAEDILELSDQEDADVNRNRLQVDTRKWLLSRLKPGVYGDKHTHTHEGGESPIKTVQITGEMSAEEASQLYRELLGQ